MPLPRCAGWGTQAHGAHRRTVQLKAEPSNASHDSHSLANLDSRQWSADASRGSKLDECLGRPDFQKTPS